jgi:hypothetical protein
MGTENNWTEIICVMDRSGSMQALTTDTIGGFNAFVGRQREEEGRARITLALFDNEYEVPWDHRDIAAVGELDDKTYYTRGSTALLDAVGLSVASAKGRIEAMDAAERPTAVIVLIVTDGYENASQEYTLAQVRTLVAERQNAGWEFVFLGADIDSIDSAQGMGMASGSASSHSKTAHGTHEAYSKLNRAVSNLRRTGSKGDVDEELDDDSWI